MSEWFRHKFQLEERGVEHALYWISIPIVLFSLLGYALAWYLSGFAGLEGITGCGMKALWGIPCPGCGGTRAVLCLLKGQIGKSLYYHAFAVYFLTGYGIFFVTQTLQRLTKGKIQGLKYHNWYLTAGIVILAVQYALKLFVPGYRI